MFFFFEHLQRGGRTRDNLDVMPFPAGAMHYRVSRFGKTGGAEIHKVLLTVFCLFVLIEKKDKNGRVKGGQRGG